ncbi:Thermostable hemolysin [Paraburkholderia caribensis MBA4]|uniref:Thermostable hemolysin n=2 Tax=Paraburkholderia caribensis TaxID=75105 RepID=A0A0P0RG48_9BURK|nr:thermostable hemolysin [Paraburkholderia caribensis]ALL67625.1 Thermostable hemolysin [Paraburkholderia caribensis MBA4]
MYIVRAFHPGQGAYRQLQQAVKQNYFQSHGARPEPNPDQFWCLTDRNVSLPGYACLGLSWGDSTKLFSEHYVDISLTETYGISRSELIEIGQFSSFEGKGAGRFLIAQVLQTLAQHQYRRVLMTATEQVRHIVRSLNVEHDDLGVAYQSRVRDRHVEWGSYYRNAPRVIVADLASVLRSSDLPSWSPPSRVGRSVLPVVNSTVESNVL